MNPITNNLGFSFFGNNADSHRAQLRLGESSLPALLTEYAEKATTILEVGTWRGEGSTFCLWLGMKRPDQRLFTIEVNSFDADIARRNYDDPRMTFLWGTLSPREEMMDFCGTTEAHKISYNFEKDFCIGTNPCVLDQIPASVDLCFMDGGNWNGEGDFKVIASRCRWLALDDTNEDVQLKHSRLRARMIEGGWEVLHDDRNDRGTGTFLAENPNWKATK